MKKRLSLVLVALMLISLLTGCQQTATGNNDQPNSNSTDAEETTEPYYVAMHIPLTGDAAQYGEYISNGFMVAIDECNANGGINGRKIEVEIFDDKSERNKKLENRAREIFGE